MILLLKKTPTTIKQNQTNTTKHNKIIQANMNAAAAQNLLFYETNGYIFSIKNIFKIKKIYFTLLKNISVTQSLSVSWLVFWKFNGDSNLFPDRSDQKIDCRYCGGRYLF